MSIELRTYQSKLNNEVQQAWSNGFNNVLMVLPTGGGKTVCLSDIVHNEPGAVCVIAHRQELVSQISMALARNGIVHRIIGPRKVIQMIQGMHLEEFGRLFYDSQSHIGVAGVDTLIRRGNELSRWLLTVKLWVIDECFPAGTMIDNKPIEDIEIGDYVNSFNERTGTYHKRKVTRLFKNPMPKFMVSIETESHHVLKSTKGHPYWTKRGWVNAVDLTTDDEVLIYEQNNIRKSPVFSMWENYKRSRNNRKSKVQIQEKGYNILSKIMRLCSSSRTSKKENTEKRTMFHLWETCESHTSFKKSRQTLLQRNMCKNIHKSTFIRNNEKNKSEIRIRKNEKQQSDEKRIIQAENVEYIEKDRTQTEDTRREWERSNTSGKTINKIIKALWFQITINCKNWIERSINGLPLSLQNRLWSQRIKNSYRSRREQSQYKDRERERQQKGCVSYWSRVASVKVHKSNDNGKTKRCYVYNIEVDELHTYTANGVTVHNCHHVQSKNKWGTAVEMFPNARGLGVTATPLRADGGGLGADNDGEFHTMCVGPSMRDLINEGYLTEYRIFAPVNNIDMSHARVSKATGDWNKNDVSDAVKKSSLVVHEKSTVVGDVVAHYLKIAYGKLGITFVPDMETGREIEAQFNSVGIPAKLVNAKTPDNERANIIRQFSNKQYLQLINVDLFGEGFDLPALEVASFARPTQSYGLYVQMFGRVLRLLAGKTHGIIIDHVGNVARHGLPDSPRQWSLEPRSKRSSNADDDTIPVKVCPECTFVYERFRKACPDCGHIPVPASRTTIEHVDGDLTELDPAILAEMRGEIDNVGLDIDVQAMEYKRQLQLKRCPDIALNKHVKHMIGKLQHQKSSQIILRDKMAWWAGHRRSEGRSDDELFKIFYLKYGVDWLTAQTLSGVESDELIKRIGAVEQ